MPLSTGEDWTENEVERTGEETMLLSLYLLGHMSLWTGEEMKWRGNDAVTSLSVRTHVS